MANSNLSAQEIIAQFESNAANLTAWDLPKTQAYWEALASLDKVETSTLKSILLDIEDIKWQEIIEDWKAAIKTIEHPIASLNLMFYKERGYELLLDFYKSKVVDIKSTIQFMSKVIKKAVETWMFIYPLQEEVKGHLAETWEQWYSDQLTEAELQETIASAEDFIAAKELESMDFNLDCISVSFKLKAFLALKQEPQKGEKLKAWTYKKSLAEDLDWLWSQSKAAQAVPVLLQATEAVVEYAKGRPIVCMARDFLWLYALLCHKQVPCYLYPFSRLQIGDAQSVKVLVEELEENKVDPTKVVFIDSQGQGSIYDYLMKTLHSMGYEVSSEQFTFMNCKTNKYSSLLPEYSCEEIEKVERGLYHLVGRSKGFILNKHWEGLVVDWDVPDTNLSPSLLTDHRVKLAQELGLPSFWSGITGYSKGQRTWGLNRVQREVILRVPSYETIEAVKEQGYLTLRETGKSSGLNDCIFRNKVEFEKYGFTTPPRYGVIEYYDPITGAKSDASRYGKYALVLKPEVMVVCSISLLDSLYNQPMLQAPSSIGVTKPKVESYLEVQVHSILNGDSFIGYYTPEKEFVAF